MAVDNASGRHHIHTDHLGTTRRVTDSSNPAQVVEATTLFPFGGYTETPVEGSEELLFTGHERDARSTNPDAALDYMHARYFAPHLGRFLSVDPVLGEAGTPQSWNRYAYVLNNPGRLVDPSGENSSGSEASPDTAGVAVISTSQAEAREKQDGLARFLELAGLGLLNLKAGVEEGSKFLNDHTFGLLGLYSRLDPDPPEVMGGEVIQGFGNAIVVATTAPLLVEGTGAIVGGSQALGGTGVAIGNLPFTASAARAGYGILNVPNFLYTGPYGGAQTAFQTVAGLRNLVSGAPIILGPSGPITAYVEMPFLIRMGATLTTVGGVP